MEVLGFLKLCDHLGKSELGTSLSVRIQKVVNVGLRKFWVFLSFVITWGRASLALSVLEIPKSSDCRTAEVLVF